MANIETGIFIVIVLLSFGFMGWSAIRSSGVMTNILRLVSITVFFGLALFLNSGYGVASTQTIQENLVNPLTGALIPSSSTVTSVLIPDDGTGAWLGWVFMSFAFISIALLVQDQWRTAIK